VRQLMGCKKSARKWGAGGCVMGSWIYVQNVCTGLNNIV
jgi:hypothetical protein